MLYGLNAMYEHAQSLYHKKSFFFNSFKINLNMDVIKEKIKCPHMATNISLNRLLNIFDVDLVRAFFHNKHIDRHSTNIFSRTYRVKFDVMVISNN